jgi:hypothetical protein
VVDDPHPPSSLSLLLDRERRFRWSRPRRPAQIHPIQSSASEDPFRPAIRFHGGHAISQEGSTGAGHFVCTFNHTRRTTGCYIVSCASSTASSPTIQDGDFSSPLRAYRIAYPCWITFRFTRCRRFKGVRGTCHSGALHLGGPRRFQIPPTVLLLGNSDVQFPGVLHESRRTVQEDGGGLAVEKPRLPSLKLLTRRRCHMSAARAILPGRGMGRFSQAGAFPLAPWGAGGVGASAAPQTPLCYCRGAEGRAYGQGLRTACAEQAQPPTPDNDLFMYSQQIGEQMRTKEAEGP